MFRLLVLSASIFSMLVFSIPAQAAQPVSGPNSVACAEAIVRAKVAAKIAVEAGDALANSQSNLVALQADVQAKAAILTTVTGVLQGLPLGTNPATAISNVAKAQADLSVALLALLKAANPTPLKDALAQAQAALAVAIKVRVDACTPPPVVVPPTTTTPTPPPVKRDLDCEDLTRENAQKILDADKSDPNKLDRDGDGTACEPEDVPQVATVPVDAPETGDGSTE